MSALQAEPLWIAKVSDFGTMKLKMESTAYANQTMPIGTAMFMAPEGYELEDGDMQPERFHPKKTEVYSFGLICFCVLIGEPTPFPPTELMNPSVKAFKGRVRSGKRWKLPLNCPNCLSGLSNNVGMGTLWIDLTSRRFAQSWGTSKDAFLQVWYFTTAYWTFKWIQY